MHMNGASDKTSNDINQIVLDGAGAVMAALHGPNPVLLREMVVRFGENLL